MKSSQVTSQFLEEYVLSIHQSPSDFSEGDLFERIHKFEFYELQTIALSELDEEEWHKDEARVEDYAERDFKNSPPVILHRIGSEYSIVDGIHRIAAFKKSGRKTILAYVGTRKSNAS